jgi:membrane-associated protease RseP (regulator of RpoE activity)
MIKKLQILALAIASSAVAQAQDLSQCKNICEKQRIVETGPFIGIRFNQIAGTETATILEVIPNTAAQRSSLAVGDVVMKFENTPIKTNAALIKMVAAHQPGDVVSITYKHNNEVITKNITLGALHTKTITVKECCDEAPVNTLAQITISPNPAQSIFTLKSSVQLIGKLNVSIYDSKGTLVKTINQNNDGFVNLPIDVSELANGSYFVRAQCKEQQFSERLVISK